MRHPRLSEEKAVRALLKAGCGQVALHLLISHVGKNGSTGDERAGKLFETAEFATSIGRPAAHDYFRAIEETRAVAELTDGRVLAFARSIDRHTAEWYFWAIWGTKAVRELTDERVLRAVDFFRSIDSPATVEYFLAIRETRAAAELTGERVLAFARSIGSDAAVEFFGACWETKAVAQLTDERILTYARSIGGDASREYFRAIRETMAATELTGEKVLAFARAQGTRLALEYFRAIRETKSVAQLTGDNVLLFAESIGKGPARAYFRAIGSTKAVVELTGRGLLDMSGVIRSIGSDAALDYFLAIATTGVVPPTSRAAEGGNGSDPTAAVPVLTLLDIPTYDGYRSAGLFGASAAFWWGMWQLAYLSPGVPGGLVHVTTALAAWIGLLCGVYFVLGAIAQRSAEEFLRLRRRLLNEHGIRWHDCIASGARCALCWSAGRTHEDARYDYERFCRCPAC